MEKQAAVSTDRSGAAKRADPTAVVITEKGREILKKIKQAYSWKDQYKHPAQEFLSLKHVLLVECQEHLSPLSANGTKESMSEADALVEEIFALRNHWGPNLLPMITCNAFVRECIYISIDNHHYRIDCAQFFEPVPFYPWSPHPEHMMKLFRFSVYDLSKKDEIVFRYFLERSNVFGVYYVLGFVTSNMRGQIHPYGDQCPKYWDLRKHMLSDARSRLSKDGSSNCIITTTFA